ncbi:fluoride efflux transporter CrcB [Crenalkalicoccus roseus]|uniref:fluoride efflux transporter CrcB n=1 Tax=Crenalkalicoccus roseus TaxID=1485588 RepID=UPI001081D6A0|nr:fluoride efflux transporter CrcB [Crenalkalicoccus roseus]
MTELLAVALGGAAGACARFWLSGLVARRLREIFPWGTLTVNATGALAIGLLSSVALRPEGLAPEWRGAWLALAVGVLGSYTTVSSFSLQTLTLAQAGEGRRALLNLLASLALCLGAVAAGHLAGARLFGG